MTKPTISQATRRDLRSIADALGDLLRDMRSPLFWIALAIIVFFLVAPWVA